MTIRYGHTTTHVTFDEVAIHGQKSGKCPCGKRRVRKASFSQTINPFNKNPDGTIKTQAQIYPEIKAERDEWMKQAIFCDACHPLTYWKLSEEQRKEYNEKGELLVSDKSPTPKMWRMVKGGNYYSLSPDPLPSSTEE